jgi:hypothetical protein
MGDLVRDVVRDNAAADRRQDEDERHTAAIDQAVAQPIGIGRRVC